MYRLHGAIHAYGGTTVSARDTADSVITALTPAAWYRNATGVTEAGGFASQWDDYSGNARHLVQATGTNQPAYAAGVFTFDGVDNFMKFVDAAVVQPVTIYSVISQASWANNEVIYDGETFNAMMLKQTSSSPNIQPFAGTGGVAVKPLTIGNYGIVCVVFNGASSSLRIDNNAAATGNAGSPGGGGFSLGAYSNGASASAVSAKEIVMFLAAHDTTTQDSVITALNNALTVF